jgi:hypothetical protein
MEYVWSDWNVVMPGATVPAGWWLRIPGAAEPSGRSPRCRIPSVGVEGEAPSCATTGMSRESRWQRVRTRRVVSTCTRTRTRKILPVRLPVPACG